MFTFLDEIPTVPTAAKRQYGAVSFDEIPIGASFFFGGEFTRSNVKTSGNGWKKNPSDRWSNHLRSDYLVYPDPSLYL